MKTCPKCTAQVEDQNVYCSACGYSFQNNDQNNAQNGVPQQEQGMPYVAPTPVADPSDHTAEFEENDVKENKLYALAAYALSVVGVIIAMLANGNKKSAYLDFHIKQSLALTIAETIVYILTGLLSWTCIVLIAGGVAIIALYVVRFICFYKTCQNKSVEAPLINKLTFLK